MKRRDLLKRTPIRLAVTFSILFATAIVTLFTVLYFGISARLEGDMRHRVEETADALVALDSQKTFDDMIRVVTAEGASVRDSDFLFELVNEEGRFLAGNVRGVAQSKQWLHLKRNNVFLTLDKGEPDDQFLAIWKTLSKGRLLVGTSNREVRQMQNFLLKVLGYVLLGTAAIVGLAGVYLARQAQQRIQVFSSTLDAISQGEVGARVPMSGSADDIDQVALQVNRTLEHLQKLIENVNQSSSDIAHDLKKPIGRLRQRLDEASRLASSPAEFRTAIEAAIIDLDSITETFDALLRITQIEAGARRARFVSIDLASVLIDVVEVYAPVAEDAGDLLGLIRKPAYGSFIHADRELLVQLFANLIENSIFHCPAGTSIEINLNRRDDGLTVTISDNGHGIPAGERENVFRRLYRVERARSTPGSGLGLSMAAAIAELHNASISLADNRPGLRVEIKFPAAGQ